MRCSLPSSSRNRASSGCGVPRAELEDVPDLDRRREAERSAAARARVSLARLADVRDARLEVAPVLDAAQVEAVPVRARDVLAVGERLVEDDLAREADRPEVARVGAERRADLVLGRRPDSRAEHADELRLFEPVVAAHEREHDACRRRASSAAPSTSPSRRSRGARRAPRSSSCRASRPPRARRARAGKLRRARNAERDLEVGRVVAVRARDEDVLAGAGGREVVDRLASAHHPGLRLHAPRTRSRSAGRSGGRPPRARGS